MEVFGRGKIKPKKGKKREKKKPNVRTANWGILSTAWIAQKLAFAINKNPNSRFTAVASRTVEKAEKFAEANKGKDEVTAYGDYEKVTKFSFS